MGIWGIKVQRIAVELRQASDFFQGLGDTFSTAVAEGVYLKANRCPLKVAKESGPQVKCL